IVIAIDIGGAGVERVGEDMMDDRGGPGPAPRPRLPRTAIEPLDELADRELVLDQPAKEGLHQSRFGLVDEEMAWVVVAFRDIAIAVGGFAAQVHAGPRPLEFAAAKALTDHRALILGQGALNLEEELVVRIVGDGALEKHDLTAQPAELFQQQ